jgi:hypothetical protein
MTILIRSSIGSAWLAAALLLSVTASAQQKAQNVPRSNRAYDVSRETVLQGTVLTFTEASSVPPIGAHVIIQTASGLVDVHLGSPQLLSSNHFTLSAGDSVRIVGENLAFGADTQFAARLIQKGNQSLALRSMRGFPLRPVNSTAREHSANSQAGVL